MSNSFILENVIHVNVYVSKISYTFNFFPNFPFNVHPFQCRLALFYHTLISDSVVHMCSNVGPSAGAQESYQWPHAKKIKRMIRPLLPKQLFIAKSLCMPPEDSPLHHTKYINKQTISAAFCRPGSFEHPSEDQVSVHRGTREGKRKQNETRKRNIC